MHGLRNDPRLALLSTDSYMDLSGISPFSSLSYDPDNKSLSNLLIFLLPNFVVLYALCSLFHTIRSSCLLASLLCSAHSCLVA